MNAGVVRMLSAQWVLFRMTGYRYNTYTLMHTDRHTYTPTRTHISLYYTCSNFSSMCHFFIFSTLYLFGFRSENQHLSHFISLLIRQPRLLLLLPCFCMLLFFSTLAFLSLQLCRLKSVLALKRESCQSSCPHIKHILSRCAHTHNHAHTHTDVSIWLHYLRSSMCCSRNPHMPRDW